MTSRPVVGYVRVSTGKQAESLEAQTAKIRAMALVKDVEVADLLVDTTSAKSLQRPAMRQLLARVDAGQVGTVIIAKLDRLTRSIGDLADLLERFEDEQVALVSVNESLDTRSSAGRLVIHILGSVAQWEREAIGERTRDVLQHKRAKGERVGTLPFGSQLAADGVHLEPAPLEQQLQARITELQRSINTTRASCRAIAERLRAEGYTTRRGTPVPFQTVARVLKMAARR
jgi:site-specific DNA recombinase